MAESVIPVSLLTFKMMKEYERTGRTIFPVGELYVFAHKALKIAGEIDNEDYWIVSPSKYSVSFYDRMSKICDISIEFYKLNEDKLNNGGKEYADKIISSMMDSFYKGANQVFDQELQEKEEALLCD